MSDCPTAILCLGSNIAARERNISLALVRLENYCRIVASSPVYETPDDSGIGAPYFNVVMLVSCRLTYDDFKAVVKQMEKDFGRDEKSKSNGCMPLDIDIIIWDGKIVDDYQFSRDYFQKGLESLELIEG